MLWKLFCLALVVFFCHSLAGCGATPLQSKTEDYAALRESFKTQPTRHGPSPQPSDPFSAPPGGQLMNYTSGGHQLKAIVDAVPDDGRRRPAVLFLHGGFAYSEEDWLMPQPFRDAGYFVMLPILRGENGQPGEFSLFYDELSDVLAAAEALAQLPQVNPEKIYVAGHSVGGTLTALAAMSSRRFRAATAFSGSMDVRDTLSGLPAVAVFNTADPREIEMRSPLAFPRSFKCPTRLIYGQAETWARAPTQRTAKLASEHSLDVQASEVPGDHFSSVPAAMQQAIQFFQQH